MCIEFKFIQTLTKRTIVTRNMFRHLKPCGAQENGLIKYSTMYNDEKKNLRNNRHSLLQVALSVNEPRKMSNRAYLTTVCCRKKSEVRSLG